MSIKSETSQTYSEGEVDLTRRRTLAEIFPPKFKGDKISLYKLISTLNDSEKKRQFHIDGYFYGDITRDIEVLNNMSSFNE